MEMRQKKKNEEEQWGRRTRERKKEGDSGVKVKTESINERRN